MSIYPHLTCQSGPAQVHAAATTTTSRVNSVCLDIRLCKVSPIPITLKPEILNPKALNPKPQYLGPFNTSPGLKFRRTWLHHPAEDAEYREVHFTWPG